MSITEKPPAPGGDGRRGKEETAVRSGAVRNTFKDCPTCGSKGRLPGEKGRKRPDSRRKKGSGFAAGRHRTAPRTRCGAAADATPAAARRGRRSMGSCPEAESVIFYALHLYYTTLFENCKQKYGKFSEKSGNFSQKRYHFHGTGGAAARSGPGDGGVGGGAAGKFRK